MAGVHRWNAVFLFLVGIDFEERMRELVVMPPQSTTRRGIWIFQSETVTTNVRNLVYGREVERRMQPIGDVGILMQFPKDSSATPNLRQSTENLPLAFFDMWNEERMPRAADRFERSPSELCRLVKAYLPEEWGLVALGITTAIADIMHDGFVDDQVIVLDSSPTRTRFVYNTLQEVFDSEL